MEKQFKRTLLALRGYVSPPQEKLRAKINQNESPFDLPQDFKQRVLEKVATLSWNRYPLNEPPVLKSRIAAWHQVHPDQVLLGNGSNQLLQTLLLATIEPNEKVLFFPPTFGLFELFTALFNGQAVQVFRPPGEPFPLAESLAAIKKEQPKLILLCSPNNPTGAEITLTDLQTICEAAPGFVFMDEAYGEFSAQTSVSMVAANPNLIISRTFSKAFSMAGLRLGYLIASAENISQLRKANLPYNVNLLTGMIAEELLLQKEIMLVETANLIKEREWLYRGLQGVDSLQAYPSGANFILFHCKNARSLFNKLKSQGILVRDVGDYPLLENHLRVSVGTRQENEWFLHALKASL